MLRHLTSTLLFCSYLLGTGPEQAQCGAAQAAIHRGHHGGGVVNRAELTLVRDPIKVQVSAFYFWRACICERRSLFCKDAWQTSQHAPVCKMDIDDGPPQAAVPILCDPPPPT